MKLIATAVLALFAGLSHAAPLPLAAPMVQPVAGRDPAYQRLMDKVAPALVSVKFVLKMEGGGPFGGGDQEMEAMGVLIEADGLVLVSSMEMGGFMARMGMQATPSDIKVLVGDDTEGVKAKLVSRDTELDQAWVKIDAAPEKPYPVVSLADAATPALGDPLYAVSRMGKFMDRAPIIIEGKLGGMASKPRHLLLGGMSFAGQVGRPVFDGAGKFVGVITMMMPEEDESDMSGGMFGSMRDMFAGVILPAQEVASATQRAKEHADKPAETPAAPAPEASPAETPKKD